MEFYLLDWNLNILKMIESYMSVIWAERFYTSGDFELYLPDTRENSEMFQITDGHAMYLMRLDDPTKVGIIENIKHLDKAEEGKMLLVSGHTDDYFLHYRLILEQVTYTGNVEQAIRHMITNAFIASELGFSLRTSDKFLLGPTIGLTDDISVQYQGQYIDEELAKLCQQYEFGYQTTYDKDTKKFTFNLIQSTDRSMDQTAVTPVIFSGFMNNVSSQESEKHLPINAAYAYGQGNGAFKFSNGYTDPSLINNGLERREGYVDAEDISNQADALLGVNYAAILTRQAQAAVDRSKNGSDTATADVLPDVTYKYGVDYNLGDIVQVIVNDANGIGTASYKQRIIEVIEAVDETGYTCIPTFETVAA